MKILFVSLPAWGHMDLGGCIRVASLLQKSHQVAWATGYPVKSYVQKQGFVFFPVAPHKDVSNLAEQSRPLDGWKRQAFAIDNFFLNEESLAIGIQELLDACLEFRPDLICSEPFHFCTSTVAEILNIPWATYGRNIFPSQENTVARSMWLDGMARLNRVRSEHHLKPLSLETASLSTELCLSFSCPSFELENLPSPGASALVGVPLLDIVPERPIEKADPYAVVSLGSVFRDATLLESITDAVLKMGWKVVLSQGVHSSLPPELTKLDGVLILPYIDHAEWFPHAEVVICHGGYSTTKDALSVGVPLLVIPLGSDNPNNAKRVKKTGTGICLPRQDTSSNAIHANLIALRDDPKFRINSTSLQAEFGRYGGAQRATELLLL